MDWGPPAQPPIFPAPPPPPIPKYSHCAQTASRVTGLLISNKCSSELLIPPPTTAAVGGLGKHHSRLSLAPQLRHLVPPQPFACRGAAHTQWRSSSRNLEGGGGAYSGGAALHHLHALNNCWKSFYSLWYFLNICRLTLRILTKLNMRRHTHNESEPEFQGRQKNKQTLGSRWCGWIPWIIALYTERSRAPFLCQDTCLRCPFCCGLDTLLQTLWEARDEYFSPFLPLSPKSASMSPGENYQN